MRRPAANLHEPAADRPTRADALKDAIAQAILQGDIRPGQRLDEVSVAHRFAVSRTPVREALKQLAAMELVAIRPHRGAVVAGLEPARLVELFEAMAEIEAACARLAASRMDGVDRLRLEEAFSTCDQALQDGAIERIHVVEIVEPVVSVMNAYTERQRGSVPNAFADPRVSTTIADARHQLLVSPETYDVIVAEAIVPEAAHSGLLFSVEYFRQVRERLKPGGIVVEWVPTQRTLNTFRKVFPYVVRTGRVLIGSNEPIDFSLEAFAERLRGPARPHLEQGGWQAEDVMAWLTSVPLQRWTPDDPPPLPDINTDLFPKDEYFLNNGRRW